MEELNFNVLKEEQKMVDRNGDNKWKKMKRKKMSRRILMDIKIFNGEKNKIS